MSEDFLNQISKQAQDYYKETPAIILGSGSSAAFGLSGMWALAEHLVQDIHPENIAPGEQELWQNFCKLLTDGVDLESALHQVQLPLGLTEKVVVSTWNLLVPEDIKIFNNSLNESNLFVLGKLLKHMFRSTSSHVNIITPNYDRLAEYACEQENIHHYTGFTHGYRRKPARKDYLQCSRQVNIWKVHGSLDWFIDGQGVISAIGNVGQIPDGLKPLIVTPGIEKYRNTHKEPFKTTIHESDDVIDSSTSYLCIGFGFNDEHIQEKLVNRCARGDSKVIVITRSLSESARKFLFEGNVENYLAIERGENDEVSTVHTSLFEEPVTIDGNYWALDGFINLIM